MKKDPPNDGLVEMASISTLKGKKKFQEVYKKGSRLRDKGVLLIFIKHIQKDEDLINRKKKYLFLYSNIEIGIPINRKYGNAISRNKAKRRIRSICRELLKEAKKSYFIIIRPSVDFKKLSYKEAKSIVNSLFKKSGILQS